MTQKLNYFPFCDAFIFPAIKQYFPKRNPLTQGFIFRISLQLTFLLISCLILKQKHFSQFSFAVDWRNSGKYPARVVFYINICFFVSNVGWCLQFIPGARRLMTCRSDHTTRIHEPLVTFNLYILLFIFRFSIAFLNLLLVLRPVLLIF